MGLLFGYKLVALFYLGFGMFLVRFAAQLHCHAHTAAELHVSFTFACACILMNRHSSLHGPTRTEYDDGQRWYAPRLVWHAHGW